MNIDEIVKGYDADIVNIYMKIIEIERRTLNDRVYSDVENQIKAEIERER